MSGLFENYKLIEYLDREEVKNLKFLNYFYGIKPNNKDIKRLKQFTEFVNLYKKYRSIRKISKLLSIPETTLFHWLNYESLPQIIRLLGYYINLGNPKKGLWVSINSTKGGIFTGPWINVPKKINSINCIKYLFKQIKSLTIENKLISNFNLTKEYLIKNKELMFSYLLGVMVGDASKHPIKRSNRTTRRLQLRLTKKYDSNIRFGDYFCLCVKSLGLRISRCKDCPAGKHNDTPFYAWHSQSSQLIQWIFDVCLGLKNNEVTTYNSIRSEWILNTSKEFKISFLQGLADSDGFVDLSAIQIGIITHPNTDLIEELFKSLNVDPKRRFLTKNKLWVLIISVNDAHKLPIFNEYVNSYRLKRLKKLNNAKHLKGHWPIKLKNKIDNYIKLGFSGTKLVEKILEEENIIIRCKGINRRKSKLIELER